MFIDHKEIERLRAQYPVGSRIVLDHMGDDPRPIPAGSKGTVIVVDDIGTVHCSFDNGRRLGLIPGEDSFHRLQPKNRDERCREMIDHGNDCTAYDKGRADVLLYAEPTNSQPDREHRVSESGHGHDRERLLLFLERIQRRSEDTGVQG